MSIFASYTSNNSAFSLAEENKFPAPSQAFEHPSSYGSFDGINIQHAFTIFDKVSDDNPDLEIMRTRGVTVFDVEGKTFLAVAGAYDDAVSVFSVSTDGSLSLTDEVTFKDEPSIRDPHELDTAVFDGTTYLLIADQEKDGIYAYRVASDGSLMFTDDFAQASHSGDNLYGGTDLKVVKYGDKALILTTRPGENGVSSLTLNSNGILNQVAFSTNNGTSDKSDADHIAVAQVGSKTFLYSAESRTDSIQIFEVHSNGQFMRVGETVDSSATALDGAIGMETATINSKTFLFASGRYDSGISVFSINSDGSLQHIQTTFDNASMALQGTFTLESAILNGNHYLFASGTGDSGVSVFSISSNGHLTHKASFYINDGLALGTPYGLDVFSIGGSNNAYLAVTDFKEGGVSIFNLNATYQPHPNITLVPGNASEEPTNNVPQSANKNISLSANESYDFDTTDFSFSDQDESDTLYEVQITSFNLTGGSLTLSGDSISPGHLLSPSQISSLSFTSASSADESSIAKIEFKVSDGKDQSSTYTISINVTVQDLNIEVNFVGGDSADDVVGSNKNDEIRTGGGNDTIDAGNGNDLIVGGNGSDRIDAGDGNDQIYAGPDDVQNDTIEGGAGDDIIGGGRGNDMLVGGEIAENISTGNTIDAGNDTIFGGDGDDTISGGSFDSINGRPAVSGGGANTIWAGKGADTVFGDDDADIIGSGEGNDKVFSGAGNDVIFGGGGDLGGNDTLDGEAGNDVIYASRGADSVIGGDGDDSLFGGGDSDTLDGGAGSDQLYGAPGDDKLTGGTGADTFAFFVGFGDDIITDFETGDTIKIGLTGFELSSIQQEAKFENGNTLLTIGTHGTILLEDVTETEFQSFVDAGQILV